MTTSFDPYHKWLGIRPKDQPPNHYRLLAIELFESDPDVIRDAAEQRIAHVRSYQLGQHMALSQQILNELAAAKACLLDSEKKAAYDQSLWAALAPLPPPLEPPTDVIFDMVFSPAHKKYKKPTLSRIHWTFVGLSGVVAVVVLILVVVGSRDSQKVSESSEQLASALPSVPPNIDAPKTQVAPAHTENKPTLGSHKGEVPPQPPSEYGDMVFRAIETLRENPNDPNANLIVGKYECFNRGDWKKGLPMLAKGSDAELRELAEEDSHDPTVPVEQMKLADAWWGVGGMKRARYWYKMALPDLGGLDRNRVEQRLREIGDIGSTPTMPEIESQLESKSDVKPEAEPDQMAKQERPSTDTADQGLPKTSAEKWGIDTKLAKLILGSFGVYLYETKTKRQRNAVWTFQQDGSVREKDQSIGYWEASDLQARVSFYDPSLNKAVFRPRAKDRFVGINKRANGEAWTVELTRLIIVSVWEHHAVGVGSGTLKFWSNGHFGKPDDNTTWELKGDKLTLRWPHLNAIDDCVVSPDGRSYKGKSRAGVKIWGALISTTEGKMPTPNMISPPRKANHSKN